LNYLALCCLGLLGKNTGEYIDKDGKKIDSKKQTLGHIFEINDAIKIDRGEITKYENNEYTFKIRHDKNKDVVFFEIIIEV
jgi:hypothetical protein